MIGLIPLGDSTMVPKRAPASLPLGGIWYRTKSRIRATRSEGASPGTCTIRSSPAMRLPQEIVEAVVAYLIYDLPSLRSCSLTSYSWYIAAVPHLHRTLFIGWGNPIRCMHMLGLLPFVERVRILSISKEFPPKTFNFCTQRQLSALTNVRTLEIGALDIPSLVPKIWRYFRPFLPTVRSLHLTAPKGSNQQIAFFIGLFQHLEDLSLDCCRSYTGEPEDDLTPAPPFTPPLRGRLLVRKWTKAGFFRDLVRLFGEIRFRSMDLFNLDETRFLLHACTKTLQVLHLHATDSLGEQFRLKYI